MSVEELKRTHEHFRGMMTEEARDRDDVPGTISLELDAAAIQEMIESNLESRFPGYQIDGSISNDMALSVRLRQTINFGDSD